jgi:hypothetical protein
MPCEETTTQFSPPCSNIKELEEKTEKLHGEYVICTIHPMICGSLSPQHGTSLGCGWRRWPPDMNAVINLQVP